MKKLSFITALLLVSLAVNSAFSQAPQVTGVSPQRQILNAPRSTQITATFNTAIDPASVSNLTFRVFGRQSGVIPGSLQLQNGNTQIVFTPASPMLAGEWMTVSLSKGIRSSGNVTMEKGFAWNFWTKAEPGTLNQSRIKTIPVRRSGEGHIQCYGALGCDFNDDGKTDLAIVNEISNDFRVYLNNGNNYDTMYSLHPMPAGIRASPSEAADFNHDGIVDIIVGNVGNNVLSYFRGLPNAGFDPELPYLAGNNVRGVAFGDFDGDGYDDVITANRGGNNISIFRNNGDGTFGTAQNINTVGNQETGVMVTDANNDGILDAFVACYSSGEVVLMLGDGNGSFTFSSRSALNGAPWALVVGDINKDGFPDVAAALSSSNRIGVIFSNGTGGLGVVANYTSGQFPLAIDIGDVDGDNDLDLIASNYAGGTFSAYPNNGSGVFTNTPITLPSSESGSCITVHDRDNDGDLDLAGIDEIDDLLFIFNNGTTSVNQVSSIIPEAFTLHQNYPNPFNPSTNIRVDLQKEGRLLVRIFNSTGKQMAEITNEVYTAGSFEMQWSAHSYPSGIYFAEAEFDGQTKVNRMILLK